jgi:hypothetical protein
MPYEDKLWYFPIMYTEKILYFATYNGMKMILQFGFIAQNFITFLSDIPPMIPSVSLTFSLSFFKTFFVWWDCG